MNGTKRRWCTWDKMHFLCESDRRIEEKLSNGWNMKWCWNRWLFACLLCRREKLLETSIDTSVFRVQSIERAFSTMQPSTHHILWRRIFKALPTGKWQGKAAKPTWYEHEWMIYINGCVLFRQHGYVKESWIQSHCTTKKKETKAEAKVKTMCYNRSVRSGNRNMDDVVHDKITT